MEPSILDAMPTPQPTLDQVARDRIRTWIQSTGVTQTDLSEQIGKNQAWMSRYLKGEFDADLETLQTIARVFGHQFNALISSPADPVEARVLDLFRALPASARPIAISLLESWTRLQRKPARGPSRK
jgi:transcriptional regulator with XRE-family HTH domain